MSFRSRSLSLTLSHTLTHSLTHLHREILTKAENSRTAHLIPKPQIALIEQAELKHEEDLEKVRLRNISLKTLQKKLERTLRAREQLAEGLHMIDFEQLKIENQTLNEKIEERNEELAKLKRKKTTTVQVLTHIREKLRFVEQVNVYQRGKVADIDVVITNLRNNVTTSKLDRDVIRNENKEYKAKQGFATSDLLLVDFEKRKHRSEELKAAIVELKNRYEILLKQTNNFGSMISAGPGTKMLASSSLRGKM
jgi:chromosome segregation ATPase